MSRNNEKRLKRMWDALLVRQNPGMHRVWSWRRKSTFGWTSKSALFFLAVTLLNYWPVLVGFVPLPTELLAYCSVFQYPQNATTQVAHAEMSDTLTQIYPWRVQAATFLRHGTVPLWNPRQLSGSPLLANDQSAIFYPLSWTFLFLPGPIAWSLMIIVKLTLAGWFAALFARSIGATPCAALAAGLVFECCGFMTGFQGYPLSDSALWIPLACYGVQLMRRDASSLAVVLTAGALAMVVLGGHPGMAAYGAVFVALYALLQVIFVSGYRQKFITCFCIAATLGFGIAAIQALPTLEWLTLIHRSLNQPFGPLPRIQLLAFFSRDMASSPNSIGLFIPIGAVYAGAMTLLLAPIAAFHKSKKDVAFFLAMAVITAGVAYGVEPFSTMSLNLPVIKGIKKDEILGLADLSLAVLTGLGFTSLERWQPKKELDWRRIAIVAIIGCVFLIAFSASLEMRYLLPGLRAARLDSLRVFGAIFVIALGLVLSRIYNVLQSQPWAKVALALIAVDMITFAHNYTPFQPYDTVFPPAPALAALTTMPGPFRVIGLEGSTGVNWEQMYGLEGAAGYDFLLETMFQLGNDKREDPTGIAFDANMITTERRRVIDLLNVKYLIAPSAGSASPLLASDPHRFRKVMTVTGRADTDVFENLNVLPRVLAVPDRGIEVLPSGGGQLARLHDDHFDPQKTVIVSEPVPYASSPVPVSTQKSESKLLDFWEGSGDVRFRVTVAETSILVLSQMYYPGWTVTVDGKPAAFLRTDFAFAGTHVPPGTHEVHFTYRPWTFYCGLILCVAALAVLVRFGIVCYRGSRIAHIDIPTIICTVAIGAAVLGATIGVSRNRISADTLYNHIVVDKLEVTAGQDYYVITIPGVGASTLSVRYSLNGAAAQEFGLRLDALGQARLDVPAATRKGTYHFLGFRRSGKSEWVRADATLVVR